MHTHKKKKKNASLGKTMPRFRCLVPICEEPATVKPDLVLPGPTSTHPQLRSFSTTEPQAPENTTNHFEWETVVTGDGSDCSQELCMK